MSESQSDSLVWQSSLGQRHLKFPEKMGKGRTLAFPTDLTTILYPPQGGNDTRETPPLQSSRAQRIHLKTKMLIHKQQLQI